MIRDEWLTEDRRYWLDNFKRLRDDKMKLIDENEELKKRISKLVSENTTLQNDLFSEQLLQDETDDYIDKLKTEITELKTKLYDATVKEQRLLKILKETSY